MLLKAAASGCKPPSVLSVSHLTQEAARHLEKLVMGYGGSLVVS